MKCHIFEIGEGLGIVHPQEQPGKITGISLNTATSPAQIIVKWQVGNDESRSGLIDVLRATSLDGPWQPIAKSLPNSGEYWWYLSEIDLEPFYVRVYFYDAEMQDSSF